MNSIGDRRAGAAFFSLAEDYSIELQPSPPSSDTQLERCVAADRPAVVHISILEEEINCEASALARFDHVT
jgi:hypothetical protein